MENFSEQPVVFPSVEDSLYGLLNYPEGRSPDTGVVILVGGPQYRVGSHRQFVELARGLAARGIPTFRFDFTGMGDSSGVFPGFEGLHNDIRQAINTFAEHRPKVRKFILWGLCDGASAACFYAPHDERVVGLCLANPWVRTSQGEAQAFLKHYYLSRLFSKAFWYKLFSGEFNFLQALAGFIKNVKRTAVTGSGAKPVENHQNPSNLQPSLPVRVFRDLGFFAGKVMFLISGNDLTAAEFMDSIGKDRKRQKLMDSEKVTMVYMPDADHTFSRRAWMHEAVNQTANWIKTL